jgi:hypothetical protein
LISERASYGWKTRPKLSVGDERRPTNADPLADPGWLCHDNLAIGPSTSSRASPARKSHVGESSSSARETTANQQLADATLMQVKMLSRAARYAQPAARAVWMAFIVSPPS